MSRQLISRSADLARLRAEGYDIDIKSGRLLARNVPYVTATKEIKRGVLVSELTVAGDVTAKPSTHVVDFIGEYPCDRSGTPIVKIKNASDRKTLAEGLIVDHTFSSKPTGGSYADYYEKMTTYIAILSSPAQAIDDKVTAKTHPVIELSEQESVFKYLDTATSRAGIDMANAKLELARVAIVGLGGTGAYVLDLVAKTPVKYIHLFEGDKLLNHNAFRSPGAPSVDELRQQPAKAAYFQQRYSNMRRNIEVHDCFVNSSTVDQLQGMDFVFLCIDRGGDKRLIIEKLEQWGTSFVDVGMGLYLVNDSVAGIVRVTASTPSKREHVRASQRIPMADIDDRNEYATNIQVADLNMLNAALAVIKWKKLYRFYNDLEKEHHCAYTIDGNTLTNEDLA